MVAALGKSSRGAYKVLTPAGTKDEIDIPASPKGCRMLTKAFLVMITGAILYCTFAMLFDNIMLLSAAGPAVSYVTSHAISSHILLVYLEIGGERGCNLGIYFVLR
jgi:hypothetical protein